MAERVKVRWQTVHRLAAELALNRVSKNLVQDVIHYLRAYPETPLLDYVAQLKRLNDGDYFRAGKSGPYERVDLYNALIRVPLSDTGEPALQLSWVARLIDYYTGNPARAAQVSRLPLREPRRGERLKGVVRESSKEAVWVQVASGQWGKARPAHGADVGDEVTVEVTRVRDAVAFEVNILRVTHPVTSPSPATPEPAQAPPTIEVSAARDRQISEAANDFMAFWKKKLDAKEDET